MGHGITRKGQVYLCAAFTEGLPALLWDPKSMNAQVQYWGDAWEKVTKRERESILELHLIFINTETQSKNRRPIRRQCNKIHQNQGMQQKTIKSNKLRMN